MADKTSKYVILEDAYYTALDIREIVRRLRPGYRLIGITDETSEAVRMIVRYDADMMIANTTVSTGDSIRELQDASVSIPTVFISDYSEVAERIREHNLNMVDFILKPVTLLDMERAFCRLDSMSEQSLK